MDARRVDQILWFFTASSVAASAAIAFWASAAPLAAGSPNARARMTVEGRTAGPKPDVPPLAAFEEVWDVELRQPLTDAPPPPRQAATAPSPVAAMPMLRLTGTVIEPGRSMAVLLLPGGKLEIRGVGDRSAGAEIRAIEADHVIVRQDGRDLTLRLEQPPRKGP